MQSQFCLLPPSVPSSQLKTSVHAQPLSRINNIPHTILGHGNGRRRQKPHFPLYHGPNKISPPLFAANWLGVGGGTFSFGENYQQLTLKRPFSFCKCSCQTQKFSGFFSSSLLATNKWVKCAFPSLTNFHSLPNNKNLPLQVGKEYLEAEWNIGGGGGKF